LPSPKSDKYLVISVDKKELVDNHRFSGFLYLSCVASFPKPSSQPK